MFTSCNSPIIQLCVKHEPRMDSAAITMVTVVQSFTLFRRSAAVPIGTSEYGASGSAHLISLRSAPKSVQARVIGSGHVVVLWRCSALIARRRCDYAHHALLVAMLNERKYTI